MHVERMSFLRRGHGDENFNLKVRVDLVYFLLFGVLMSQTGV